MEILWHGHSFFEIKGKVNENRVTLAIDPFDESIELKPKKTKADILLISHYHRGHSNIKIIEGEPFLIDTPGEYEVKGVKIKGIPSFHDKLEGERRGQNTIFKIEVEGIKVCHMGDFGEDQLSSDRLEEIFGVDILLIPVGGTFTLSGKEAAKITGQIEPKIVIPMHYKINDLNLELESEKDFLRALGTGEKEKIKKLKLKAGKIRTDGTEVILLEPVL